MNVISLSNATKTYPPKQVAVSNISLQVSQGEFIFIAGASGAGKSTLLKLLLGAERATSGDVSVLGTRLAQASDQHIAALRRSMGIVFQDFRLLSRRTVLDNVGLTLELKRVAKVDRQRMSLEMLAAVGLETRAYDYPDSLSGGEQQRVALARALVHKPQILYADEPTGNLDARMSRVVFDLLLEANAAGVTVVVASHNLTVIEELNLRTIVLDQGTIIGDFQQGRGIR